MTLLRQNRTAFDNAADGCSITIATRAELKSHPHWQAAFFDQRKDRRYYEIVEDTILQGFDYRYLVIRDLHGEVCAVQPCFLLDQDLLEGASAFLKRTAAAVRCLWPRFLTMRTLMIGCAAGEGHLDRGHDSWAGDARLIADNIDNIADQLGVSLIVLKEFPAIYRDALSAFCQRGFKRIPSLPMVSLKLNFRSFDDYMKQSLNARMRSDLRRKFRDAENGTPIELSIRRDVSDIIDELYPLYLQVYDRSQMHFEKLTKEYFCALGRRMPDKARFFVWRDNGKVIAFSLTMVHDGQCCNEYLGLDYDVALKRHLYFYAFRDVMAWAIANGYKTCLGTGLSYAPKSRLKFDLYPLDLYVRHRSRLINRLLHWLLPLIEPTRSERDLKRFPNYGALWSD